MSTLFPTELIGSYSLPSWLSIVTERIEKDGDLGVDDIRETLDDAVNIALLDQERAGVDVVTDGEMRRRDFIQNFYRCLTGIRSLPPVRHFGAAGYDQNPRYEVIDRLTAPEGLGLVAEVEYLKKLAHRPFKVCLPGPMTLALPLIRKGYYADEEHLLDDIGGILRDEIKALESAGAEYLQIDEPRFATTAEDARYLVDLFNATLEGVKARVGLHLCFGNFKGRSRDYRDYSYLFPAILEAKCQQINLEFANRHFAQLDLLRHFDASAQNIGIGVVDVKSYFVETPEQVAGAIRQALNYTRPEKLVVTPDCGFNHCPRHIAFGKICAMVQGAAIVRRELSASA